MATGKQIEKHRKFRGWTFEDLSDRSGVDVGTINALEKRDSSRSKYFGPIAKAFGLTVEGLDSEPGQETTDALGEDALRIARMYMRIASDASRQAVEQTILGFVALDEANRSAEHIRQHEKPSQAKG